MMHVDDAIVMGAKVAPTHTDSTFIPQQINLQVVRRGFVHFQRFCWRSTAIRMQHCKISMSHGIAMALS